METAVEPEAPQTFKIDICAIMSAPRVGWMDACGPIHGALSSVNMPLQIFTGGLWHSEMENALEWCIEQEFKYVLTLDYDSLVTPWHIHRLLTQVSKFPEFGAMAALQPRRIDHKALFWIDGLTGDFKVPLNEPLPVDTAHFGLTAIRLADVQDMPKPWFEPRPGKDGRWERGASLDADTSFWQKWKAAGKKLGLCADVRIGHLEMMVSYLDSKLGPQVCSVHDWHQYCAKAGMADPKGEVRLRRFMHG